MKKLLLTILLAIPILGYAQGFRYGVEVGYLHSNVELGQITENLHSSPGDGFSIGANISYSFKNDLQLESGLAFQKKEVSLFGNNIGSQKITSIRYTSLDYLRLPLYVGYPFTSHRLTLTPQVGAFMAIGIDGNCIVAGQDVYGQQFSMGYDTFASPNSGQSYYRPADRFDAGLAFALSLRFQNFGVRVAYDYSLIPTLHYGDGKLQTISASLSYWIK